MTTRPTNYNSHSSHPFVGLNWYASTSVRIRTLIFRGPDTNRLGCVAEKSQSVPVLVSFVSKFVALRNGGVCSCVQYSADRLPERVRSTDGICRGFQIRNYLNENNPEARTEMSNRSVSATSPSWPSQTKPKPTSHFWRALTLARRAAGWLMTTSRRPKSSASSSAKSCVVSTSAPKRRAF